MWKIAPVKNDNVTKKIFAGAGNFLVGKIDKAFSLCYNS